MFKPMVVSVLLLLISMEASPASIEIPTQPSLVFADLKSDFFRSMKIR